MCILEIILSRLVGIGSRDVPRLAAHNRRRPHYLMLICMKKHHKKASKKAAYMYVSLRDDLRATFPRQPGTPLPPAAAV